jgi:hypothetical protein
MKRITGAAVTTAALLASSAGALAPSAASASTAQAAQAATTPVVYKYDGWFRPAVRPGLIHLSGDSTLWYSKLTWSRWPGTSTDTTSAKATGYRYADDCIPNCALGTIHKTHATVWVKKIRFHNGTPYLHIMNAVFGRNGHTESFAYTTGGFWERR